MREYSLHSVASRPARAADELMTTKFSRSETRAIGEPNVAVCLLPGTEVAFEQEAECSHPFARLMPGLRFGKLGDKLASFRQINIVQPNAHHDALEFANGKVVLLTRLRPGQHATALQPPAPMARIQTTRSEEHDNSVFVR